MKILQIPTETEAAQTQILQIQATRTAEAQIPNPPKATYTVTFDANGGTGTIESITEVAGTEITIPENTLEKDGFNFAGWNTAKNMTGTSYDSGATFTPNSNLTLYAKWTADAANVAESIKSLEAGEHTVSVVGEIDKYKLIKIATAIINNENEVEINLDLSGTTIVYNKVRNLG
ncbi:InlB B-repeat-containing protein [uncultured Treponema sp.]|uniref:InlB B-repeat-containing protein n=1 Tax=uncultured Treponema sp. TaxID=162155 RepID=UPI0025FE7114|nr:InlB B-repeat-containing protein [uncultured Treponema sp.]